MRVRAAERALFRTQILTSRYRPTRFAALCAFTVVQLAIACGMAAASEPITVTVDRAKILRITQPATTIVIGNPAIVDATMPDDQTLVLTGKSFGTTNLIIMDAEGRQIADQVLNVRMPQDNSIVIMRGPARYTYNCTPTCERSLSVGDATTSDLLVHYDTLATEVEKRNDVSSSTGSTPAPAQ
ncbi:MAG: pilus assembly protein N-terminal domain-containing protein [Hyphomicrobiales bacterium]|nr:pilus assembly protein N-terminal domain-containing protein [Hyphomicrobiales bacterium]